MELVISPKTAGWKKPAQWQKHDIVDTTVCDGCGYEFAIAAYAMVSDTEWATSIASLRFCGGCVANYPRPGYSG